MAKLAVVPAEKAATDRSRIVTALGKQTRGKAQPDDSLVLTPTGFREIGKLSVGDLVTCPDGRVAPIDGVFPQGEKEIFQIEFHDGRTVECCDEHLWKVWVPLLQMETGKSHSKRKLLASRRWDVVSTASLRQKFATWSLTPGGQERLNQLAVPLVSPMAIELPSEDLPIPPYALGALIGDGSIGHQVASFSTADSEMLLAVGADLPGYEFIQVSAYDYRLRIRDSMRPSMRDAAVDALNASLDPDVPYRIALLSDPNGNYRRGIKMNGDGVWKIKCGGLEYTINEWARHLETYPGLIWSRLAHMTTRQALGFDPTPPRNTSAFASPLRLSLQKLGLFGTTSSTKFIPELYKRGSVSQRLALMRGLLDTDGSSAGASAEFSSTSEQLARDVQELAWSLGAIAKVTPRQTYCTYKGEKVAGAPSWRVRIVHPKISEFFSLPRKVAACNDREYAVRLRIKSIKPIGRKHARCISVDHPDHLYVTNNYVVTHNTMLIRWLAERGAADRPRPMRLLDADPHNQTLSRYLPGTLSPDSVSLEDRRVWIEQQIREQRNAIRAGAPFDAILDLGGGDLLLQRLAYEVRFTETVDKAGIDLTAFYMLGPSLDDLEYFQSLDDAGFAPRRLGLVFNAALVPAGRDPALAFDSMTKAPLIELLVKRGAVPFFMPALAAECVEAVEKSGARTFREAIPKLEMWDEMRLETWLNDSMEEQIAKPLAEMGWLV